jgi:4-hydroxy-tetrahydrodipicolinate synthase
MRTTAPRFGRVLTAMATPFTADGALDLEGAAALARWLVDHGSDGLVVAGTTGEAPTLSDDEKVELWQAVRAAVDVPILAGTGSNDTRHTCGLSQRASATGVDGLLVVSPYYNKPPQAGIEAHFRTVAAVTDLPVVVYDVPARTGRRVATDVLVRLFGEVSNLVGFKDATGDAAGCAQLVAEVPDLDVYSGDDSLTLPLLAVGAIGVIGVATHWAGERFGEMIAAFGKGEHERAREINATLIESFAFSNTETSPYSVSTKAMLRVLGLPAGECRLPLGPTPDGVEERAAEVIDRLGRPA